MKKFLALLLAAMFLLSACEKAPENYEIEKGGKYEMSDTLSGFTVALNGKVLKVPSAFSYLESLGWQLSKSEKVNTSKTNQEKKVNKK